MGQLSPVSVLIAGYDSPEGPVFDREGNLYFVNWLSSAIVKLPPDGTAAEYFNTGGIPAGLAFHRDGSLYIADEGEQWHGVLRLSPDGELTTFAAAYEGRPLNGANDLVFDEQGVLYFSDPWTSSAERPIGGFYRLFPDGRLEQLDHGLAFPNGVALNADGTAVFLAETYRRRILRYPIRPDGSVGPWEAFADLPGEPGPDGMAFAADGNLYVAHYNGGRVAIFDPAGRLVDEIAVPGRNVTNCAFGGPDRRTLIITEVATASLYSVELDVAGLPLYGDLAE